jgi:hypothetical protein
MKLDWAFMVSFMTKIDKIISLLDSIWKEQKNMVAEMDVLTQAVQAQSGVIDQAITALNGFNTQLNAINVQLQDALTQLQASQADTAALAEAKAQAVILQEAIANKTIELSTAVNNIQPPTPPVA